MFWRPRHWNLLENKYTPLIKTHMRQRPQNDLLKDVRTSERVCGSQPINASALWLTNQVAAAQSGAFEDSSLAGFLLGASPAGSASLSSSCPYLSSTPTCWSLLIHSLSLANAYIFSVWGHSLYWRRLGDIARD